MPGTFPAETPHRRQRRVDFAIGIALGLAIGITMVAAFVFLGSEGSVDAPHISGVNTGKPAQHVATSPDTTTTGESRR